MKDKLTLPASLAARRVMCAGSARLEAAQPKPEKSEDAREGEAAHEVVVRACEHEDDVLLGSLTENGEIVTREMLAGAEIFCEYLANIGCPLGLEGGEYETPVDLTRVNPACRGIPDFYFYNENTNTLHIADYKFGHTPVSPFENWQLIEYSKGVFDEETRWTTKTSEPLKFELTIIQPRAYQTGGPIQSWADISIEEMRGYWARLIAAEAAALQPEASCTPSPECKLCSARANCEALRISALKTVEMAKDNRPMHLPPAQLGQELRLLEWAQDLINARVSGLKEQTTALIKQGKTVPGYTIGRGKSSTAWDLPDEQIVNFADMMRLPSLYNRKPITAIQARDRLKTGELLGLTINKSNPAPDNLANEISVLSAWVARHTTSFPGAEKLEQVDIHAVQKLFNKGDTKNGKE